ncbi:helix-turn-helix transcriptional regulator [Planomonospora parontospora]|uniref:helix-turn-helix transcriptional regulator n=1 Tax=Planomonospora parontospora TaxID=58119 RepID=UPI0016716AEA|nr:WYL domain-containing protein [Planomonospora parontospora]GGL29263.1 transcriptional regulator [Planomonospora parontospora subsp. antibiotica]GII19740.1 transcriptional regulator [Planomonospora parontospora subsp. antibiotica]
MRAARLMSLVLLLQSRGGMTAAELARELEVSERTVHRDVLALSEAGIPVYADRGRGGGYRLLDGYRTRLTGLDRAEAEALFLSGVPEALREMGLGEVAATARLKASAALSPGLRDAPATAAQRFHLDAPGWFASERPPPEPLAPLARAVWGDHPVTALYRGAERTLEPYGLVLKAGVWYLATRSAIYRVDRFSTVAVHADRRFDRDRDFDLAAFWAGRAAEFTRSLLTTRVTVRLSPDGMRLLRHVADPAALGEALASAGEPDEQGWTTLVLPVESPEVAYGQCLRFGPEAEVVDPPELRSRLAEAAARMSRLYGPPPAEPGRGRPSRGHP